MLIHIFIINFSLKLCYLLRDCYIIIIEAIFLEKHDIIIWTERFLLFISVSWNKGFAYRINWSWKRNDLTHRSRKNARVGAAGGDRRRFAGSVGGDRTDRLLRAQELLLETKVFPGKQTWGTIMFHLADYTCEYRFVSYRYTWDYSTSRTGRETICSRCAARWQQQIKVMTLLALVSDNTSTRNENLR